ncbi:hypothetical protein [Raoultella ornithinolytica]|uniref:hypothetical protein n=1 Tax=Raoultella ornithinolytica TaxID=54291 RepID=UPI000E5915CB|nr:hypothetical protein [Raoultella ornithinolytica]CAE6345927.1 hypothetical protein AI2711V1_2443 [Raoultella ornithinolytica]CAH3510903.1 hypothetical protein AI2711V1_2443 [Raoultella ornithinolytica]
MRIIVASVILGASAIFSAAMLSGNLDFKSKNILNNDNGHVSLGKIYSENAYVDVTFKVDDDNSTILELKDLSIGSYKDGIEKEVQDIVDSYNKDKPDNKKTDKDSLSLKVPGTLTLKAHTAYRTENMPMYNLIIDSRVIHFDKDTLINKSVSDAVEKFVTDNKTAYQDTFFIKGN